MQTKLMKRAMCGVVGAAAVLLAGPGHAALFDRGGGIIYDDALNITWLQDWNRTGREMTLDEARTWADNLVVAGYDDWRLPTVHPINGSTFQYEFSNNGSTNFGFAKTGVGWGTSNELGHMFYVTLGNKGRCTPNDASPGSCVEQPDWGFKNTGPFSNVGWFYWSVPEHPPRTKATTGASGKVAISKLSVQATQRMPWRCALAMSLRCRSHGPMRCCCSGLPDWLWRGGSQMQEAAG